MKLKLYASLTLLALLLVGCTTPQRMDFPSPTDFVPISQIQILERFQVVGISNSNLFAEIQKCVKSFPESARQRVQNEYTNLSSSSIGHFHVSSSPQFWVKGDRGVCVQQSSGRYPIWPSEMLWGTVNPSGIPPDVLQIWYRQIALEIATKGISRVAYVFKNGNAHIGTYWADPTGRNMGTIYYSAEFKKSGDWSPASFHVQFTHPTMSTVSETKRGSQSQRSIFN